MQTSKDLKPLSLNELGTLSSDGIKRKKAIEKVLDKNIKNPQEKFRQLIDSLSQYDLKEIFALSANSSSIHKFFDTNNDINKQWAIVLEKLEGYPTLPLRSVNKDYKAACSLFSQVKGVVILSELQKYPNVTQQAYILLHTACELGIYHALTQRINLYLLQIDDLKKNEAQQSETIDSFVQFILQDAIKLSNLYWSIGCVDAAMMLFNIVDYYFNSDMFKLQIERFFLPHDDKKFSWIDKYKDRQCPFPIILLKTAVETLHMAHLLDEFPESKMISNAISKGKGVFAGYTQFQTKNEVEELVLKKLDSLKVPLPDIFCKLAFDQAFSNIQKNYPDYDFHKEFKPSFKK